MPPVKKNHRSQASVDVAGVVGAGSAKLRKKIRDIERLLAKKRDVMPADAVLANERALESLKVELQNVEKVNKVKKLAKKYHMVRFFERKKALRRYKQAKKEYEEGEKEGLDKKALKKLRHKLRHSEVDLCYVVNFPKDRKYISLFPNEDSTGAADDNVKKGSKKTEEQRLAFKREIEQMLKDDQLPISLQDILEGKTGERTTLASNFESQKVKETALDEGDDDDDFFE